MRSDLGALLLVLFCIFGLYECNPSIVSKIGQQLSSVREKLDEEVTFRKCSIDQYRATIRTSAVSSLRRFSTKQFDNIKEARKKLKEYTTMSQDAYRRTQNDILEKQRQLRDLNSIYFRINRVSDSLDKFRAYSSSDESGDKRLTKWLYDCWTNLDNNWEQLNTKLVTTYGRNVRANSAFQRFERATKDLMIFQEDFLRRVNALNETVSFSTPKALTKQDIRQAKEYVDSQLRKLEAETTQWVESRVKQADASLRTLQRKLLVKDQALTSQVQQRRTAIEYALLNDQTLQKVLEMVRPDAKGWQRVKQDGGISVYRQLPEKGSGASDGSTMTGANAGDGGADSPAGDAAPSKYACVKCYGEVRASPEKIFELLTDDTRTREFNSLYDKGRVTATIDERTKVVHSASITIFPFKPRDFVTVVHCRQLRDGTRLVLNRATEHELAPKRSAGYIRGTIVLAANIIQPVSGRPGWSRLTMITQVDPGGFAPASIMNQVCTLGPVGFIKNVEAAANRPKPSAPAVARVAASALSNHLREKTDP